MSRTIVALVLAAGICHAQPAPTVINGKLETRAVSGPLSNQFRTVEASAAGPLWMAYSVPSVPNQGTDCGETRHNNIARLEGSESIIVLYRFENRALDRVRVANPDCEFDSGGLPFIFLTGVKPAESVELLTGLARSWAQVGHKPHFESLVTALALHRDAAADSALEGMAAPGQSETLREKALFWLAQSRGKRGFEVVRNVLAQDSDDRIREKATFDITMSKEPGAIPALIESAQKDHTPHVRSQALFWLAHRGGKEQSAVIINAANKDSDAHVRRQAVFALSQIPNGDGIPSLVQVARTSTDTEVRKQAVFWIGQSHDPRATAFIDSVLSK
jgi:hypothetical protein